MRTLLTQFCEEFDRLVRPLLDPLQKSADSLEAAPDGDASLAGGSVRTGLLELNEQFRSLVDKVAEQQAYVLIFGPLKSGKSTLMNALSASYVSEVTSLPAYPCMVYVSHSPDREFVVTSYDGTAEKYTDPTALHMHIHRSHQELAERIRQVEEAGGDFDPPVHFPEAIRRVNVRLPAGELAQSGTVLVDTPGLYSRMKFGYDRMTREFRNAAACAIFVVKSDNLFLEQVFREFTELLDLFSRIFLVVNLDTTKRDLRPDGTLVPSAEQEDPQRIIQAFESLSMSAPLKAAAEDGRLKIYPVDLLRAGSERLTAAHLRKRGDTPDAELGETSSEVHGQCRFDSFLKDLTEYLNSTDYLVSFLGDSLRRASSLLQDTVQLCGHSAVVAMNEAIDDLERERDETERRMAAVERLRAVDWQGAFTELQEKLAPRIRTKVTELDERAAQEFDTALFSWFESDTSLYGLAEDAVQPILERYQTDLVEHVARLVEQAVQTGSAGVQVTIQTAGDLATAQVDLERLGRGSLDAIDRSGLVTRPDGVIDPLDVPVSKTFWDWILFRSAAVVRRRFFGPPERPAVRIPVAVKSARVGQPGREALKRNLDQFLAGFSGSVGTRVRERIVRDYAGSVVASVDGAVAERGSALEARIEQLNEEMRDLRRIVHKLDELALTARHSLTGVGELSQRYGQTDPDLLVRPIAIDGAAAPDGAAPGDGAPEDATRVDAARVLEGEESPDEVAARRTAAPLEEDGAPANGVAELEREG